MLFACECVPYPHACAILKSLAPSADPHTTSSLCAPLPQACARHPAISRTCAPPSPPHCQVRNLTNLVELKEIVTKGNTVGEVAGYETRTYVEEEDAIGMAC